MFFLLLLDFGFTKMFQNERKHTKEASKTHGKTKTSKKKTKKGLKNSQTNTAPNVPRFLAFPQADRFVARTICNGDVTFPGLVLVKEFPIQWCRNCHWLSVLSIFVCFFLAAFQLEWIHEDDPLGEFGKSYLYRPA